MKTTQMKQWLCILCLGLSVILPSVAAAQGDTPSVMNRVHKVEDPELGDLIRMAIENRPATRDEVFDIVRQVTQTYAQITLLDLQVEQVSQRIETLKGTAEIRYELLLAKAELESKRTTELANLREMVGIIPQLPLAKQATQTLNAYVSLQMIGERLYVLDGQEPFVDFWPMRRWKVEGFLSEAETLDFLGNKMKHENNLPIRIHIYFPPDTDDAAKALRNRIISVTKAANAQMETEVRLEEITFVGSGNATFYLRQGSITTFYTEAVQRPDGSPAPLVSGRVDPKDLEQHIMWRLMMPKNVPLTFRIEHDQQSAAVARQIVDTAGAVVKRLGVDTLVDIKTLPVEPASESAFLGRWRGETRGDVHEIDVKPNGMCHVTMGDRFGKDMTPGAIKAGTTVSGTWLLTTNEIVIDIKDKNQWGGTFTYRGHVGESGNLVVDKGIIYPQGSFHVSGAPGQMILRKVE